jgi:hypothetical protein
MLIVASLLSVFEIFWFGRFVDAVFLVLETVKKLVKACLLKMFTIFVALSFAL